MSLKELEQIIKLCRKTGVASIAIEGVSLTLTAEAPKSSYKRRTAKVAPSPFEQALSEAKDAATKAKLKYMSEQQQAKEEMATDLGGQPDELAMLLWSAGGGDGAN